MERIDEHKREGCASIVLHRNKTAGNTYADHIVVLGRYIPSDLSPGVNTYLTNEWDIRYLIIYEQDHNYYHKGIYNSYDFIGKRPDLGNHMDFIRGLGTNTLNQDSEILYCTCFNPYNTLAYNPSCNVIIGRIAVHNNVNNYKITISKIMKKLNNKLTQNIKGLTCDNNNIRHPDGKGTNKLLFILLQDNGQLNYSDEELKAINLML